MKKVIFWLMLMAISSAINVFAADKGGLEYDLLTTNKSFAADSRKGAIDSDLLKIGVRLIAYGENVTFEGEKNELGYCLADKTLLCLAENEQYVCRLYGTYFTFIPSGNSRAQLPLKAVGYSSDSKAFPVKEYSLVSCDK
jgi:hypothetical protein